MFKKFTAVLIALLLLCSLIPEGVFVLAEDSYGENIAFGKPTRSNSRTGISANVTDGNEKTLWQGDEYPKYVDIDLLANYSISQIVVSLPNGNWAYKLYGSLDGVSFDEIAEKEYGLAIKTNITHDLTDCVYRIVRINITHASLPGSLPKINEVYVYGTLSDKPVTATREKIEVSSYTEWLEKTTGKEYPDGYKMNDTFSADDVYEAIYGIIDRNIGSEYRDWFEFYLGADIGNDWYEICEKNGKINISGNNGSSIAVGLNQYLKYYCKVHISQQTSQTKMPEVMPNVEGTIRHESPYEVRYAYNYCTLSYTMQFYGYDRWQRELDYLALSGVNVILDTTATEALWVLYLQQFGYNADQAKDFVCGYAYKAWWLMGNLENTAGTVSDQWIADTVAMARVNQRFMTLLGIKPCLQGFMGMIPTDFAETASETLKAKGYSSLSSAEGGSKYIQPQGEWSGFTRPPLLKTTYDGYAYLAQTFYETQEYIYGKVTNYYAGDLAHEGGVIPPELSKAEMSSYIMSRMIEYDEEAVWIIQCWQSNPLPEVLRGFTPEEREKHLLVLDLNSTCEPGYDNMYWGSEWYGSSWVYCMLDNFGGRPGVHGELNVIMQEIPKVSESHKHMVGIGLVSEGTQMNPVVQELLWEMAWRTEPFDINEWLADYAERRYGGTSENITAAWNYLLETAYGYSGDHAFNTNPLIGSFPSLYISSSWSNNLAVSFDAVEFEKATDLIMKDFDSLCTSESYIYDCVDLIKQVISNTQYYYYLDFQEAYKAGSMEDVIMIKDRFLESIKLLDEISSYEKDSTLAEWIGRIDDWINDDRNGKYDDYDRFTMRMNARALITSWTSRYYSTYAHREYSGQLMDYNYDLWEDFFNAVVNGNPSQSSMNSYFPRAWSYIISDKEYDRTVPSPTGDANGRGIKEIWKEVCSKHLTTNKYATMFKDKNIGDKYLAYAEDQMNGYPASNLNDLDAATVWSATTSNCPTYVGVNFVVKSYFDEIEITAPQNRNKYVMQYDIQILQNDEYVTVAEAQSYNPETREFVARIKFDEPLYTSNLRVVIKSVTEGSNLIPSICELRVISNAKIIQTESKLGELKDGVLNGVPEGTTVTELKKTLTSDSGTISVVDAFGNVCKGKDIVEEGFKVLLKLRTSLLDIVTIGNTEDVPGIMKGDFDNDKEITVADALAALRIAAKLVAEDDTSILIGDIDGDLHVTVADALAILRVAAKLTDAL